jgi:indolepyruvate ferredoxin oxidoreductase
MLKQVNLSDKYDLSENSVFLTGTQALVRLCLTQAAVDRVAGLDTGGYVTGYRGSPLGGLDQQFDTAKAALEAGEIIFQPGLNEDLAATAVWGSQQSAIRGEGSKDGVFALWYGKGTGGSRKPPVFLKAGDWVDVTVCGIGTLKNSVGAE